MARQTPPIPTPIPLTPVTSPVNHGAVPQQVGGPPQFDFTDYAGLSNSLSKFLANRHNEAADDAIAQGGADVKAHPGQDLVKLGEEAVASGHILRSQLPFWRQGAIENDARQAAYARFQEMQRPAFYEKLTATHDEKGQLIDAPDAAGAISEYFNKDRPQSSMNGIGSRAYGDAVGEFSNILQQNITTMRDRKLVYENDELLKRQLGETFAAMSALDPNAPGTPVIMDAYIQRLEEWGDNQLYKSGVAKPYELFREAVKNQVLLAAVMGGENGQHALDVARLLKMGGRSLEKDADFQDWGRAQVSRFNNIQIETENQTADLSKARRLRAATEMLDSKSKEYAAAHARGEDVQALADLEAHKIEQNPTGGSYDPDLIDAIHKAADRVARPNVTKQRVIDHAGSMFLSGASRESVIAYLASESEAQNLEIGDFIKTRADLEKQYDAIFENPAVESALSSIQDSADAASANTGAEFRQAFKATTDSALRDIRGQLSAFYNKLPKDGSKDGEVAAEAERLSSLAKVKIAEDVKTRGMAVEEYARKLIEANGKGIPIGDTIAEARRSGLISDDRFGSDLQYNLAHATDDGFMNGPEADRALDSILKRSKAETFEEQDGIIGRFRDELQKFIDTNRRNMEPAQFQRALGNFLAHTAPAMVLSGGEPGAKPKGNEPAGAGARIAGTEGMEATSKPTADMQAEQAEQGWGMLFDPRGPKGSAKRGLTVIVTPVEKQVSKEALDHAHAYLDGMGEKGDLRQLRSKALRVIADKLHNAAKTVIPGEGPLPADINLLAQTGMVRASDLVAGSITFKNTYTVDPTLFDPTYRWIHGLKDEKPHYIASPWWDLSQFINRRQAEEMLTVDVSAAQVNPWVTPLFESQADLDAWFTSKPEAMGKLIHRLELNPGDVGKFKIAQMQLLSHFKTP